MTATLRLIVKEEVTTQMKKASQELEKFQKQTNYSKEAVKALFHEFAVPLSIGAAVASVTALTRESLKLAVSLADTERQARMVFGDAFPRMRQEADAMAQTMRRSESDILHYMAGFGDFLSQLGTGPRETQQMSTALAKLTVEYGKLKQSIPDEQIYEALQQGLLGNYRALKSLDVAIKDDTLQQYANSLAIKNKVKDMDAEQIATLTTMYLTQDAKKKQEELADATGTAGDNAKSAGDAWKDLQEELGKDISPIAAAAFDTLAGALGRVRAALTDSKAALMELAKYAAGKVGVSGSMVDAAVSYGQYQMGGGGGPSVPFGPSHSMEIAPGVLDTRSLVDILNQKSKKADGGGGGGESEETKALAEAKKILSEIEKINKDITDQYGKQADANKKVKEGLREDLKLKKEIGIITKQETQELERLNRRLGDGRDRIDELKEGFDHAKSAAEDFRKKVEDINDEILDIGKNLKKSLEDADREMTKRKGEKIADLIGEQKDLEGKLAAGEGLSKSEQERLEQIEEMLRAARNGTTSNQDRISELAGTRLNILGAKGEAGYGSLSAAEKKRVDELTNEINALKSNPDAFNQGDQLSKLNDLQKLDYEGDERKRELAREANEKQADAVSRLTQANIDLAAAEGEVKALQGDLALAMQAYELQVNTTFANVEEATNRHSAFQIGRLKDETDAAYSLADAYAKVAAFFNDEGGGVLGGSRSTPAGGAGAPTVTITGNVTIANESDYQALLKRLVRDIQLQTQGSSSSTR